MARGGHDERRLREQSPVGAEPPGDTAWARFAAHSPRYKAAALFWGLSMFAVPASIPLRSWVATVAAIVVTWVALVVFRWVDRREPAPRRAPEQRRDR